MSEPEGPVAATSVANVEVNAETGAEGPRWPERSVYGASFMGRAGPVDLWVDKDNSDFPFFVCVESFCFWRATAGGVVEIIKHRGINLTLHAECVIHQLCAEHNPNNQP